MPVEDLVPQDDSNIKNVMELLHELRRDNVEALFMCYSRKDGTGTRSYMFGHDEMATISILEQLKFDILIRDAETSDVVYYDSVARKNYENEKQKEEAGKEETD